MDRYKNMYTTPVEETGHYSDTESVDGDDNQKVAPEDKIWMTARDALRKLSQLRPYLNNETHIREFDRSQIKDSELAGYMIGHDGYVDVIKLIPFIIVALNDINRRVNALEVFHRIKPT